MAPGSPPRGVGGYVEGDAAVVSVAYASRRHDGAMPVGRTHHGCPGSTDTAVPTRDTRV